MILFNDPVRREWLSRPRSMTRDQFVDACMLAGTEYCLTFPYLQAEPSSQANFKSRFPPCDGSFHLTADPFQLVICSLSPHSFLSCVSVLAISLVVLQFNRTTLPGEAAWGCRCIDKFPSGGPRTAYNSAFLTSKKTHGRFRASTLTWCPACTGLWQDVWEDPRHSINSITVPQSQGHGKP